MHRSFFEIPHCRSGSLGSLQVLVIDRRGRPASPCGEHRNMSSEAAQSDHDAVGQRRSRHPNTLCVAMSTPDRKFNRKSTARSIALSLCFLLSLVGRELGEEQHPPILAISERPCTSAGKPSGLKSSTRLAPNQLQSLWVVLGSSGFLSPKTDKNRPSTSRKTEDFTL